MAKTVTLRLDEQVYALFKTLAERENRPLSNFIETSVLRSIEDHEDVDAFEMAEIQGNGALNRALKQGVRDAKARRGQFV